MLIITILILTSKALVTQSVMQSPLLEPGYYAHPSEQERQLTLGVLGFVHTRDDQGVCRHNTSLIDLSLSSNTLQQPEIIYHTVTEINQRHDILPNISLGFVFLDGCFGDLTSLARSSYFISDHYCDDSDMMNEGRDWVHFDLFGVVIHAPSRITAPVAGLMSAFDIPSLGTMATSDYLSDKEKYPMFSRISPPDKLQTKAIVALLEDLDWSYVSFLYTSGSYGQNAARYFYYWLKETEEICVAFSYMLPYEGPTVKTEIAHIVDQLSKHRNAKVVVIILEDAILEELLLQVDSRGLTGHFIWLGSDALEGVHTSKLGQLMVGAIYTSLAGANKSDGSVSSFDQYFKELNPWNSTSNNPWLMNGWASSFNCLWSDNQAGNITRESCHSYQGFGNLPYFEISELDLMLADAVYVYANAVHDVISENCPEAFSNSSVVLKHCLSSEMLVKSLRSLNFTGIHGQIEFDAVGDLIGGYRIKQVQMKGIAESGNNLIARNIGTWDKRTEQIYLRKQDIKWIYRTSDVGSFYKDNSTSNNPWTSDVGSFYKDSTPESVCSKPCKQGMAMLKQELPCCWVCHQCYEYEYLAKNGTLCESCPLYTWPEENTQSRCVDIEAKYLTLRHPAASVVLITVLLGLIIWTAICQQFVRYRKHVLILACDKEQSWYQLFGILLTFFTTFLHLTKPTDRSCTARRIGFSVSMTILYGVLLIKTVRVYRIFKLSKRGVKTPKFVSSRSQRLFNIVVILIQVFLVCILEEVSPSRAELRMPMRHEKYVELVCVYQLWAYLAPLSYNLTILFSCAVLGLLTRKLPQNFNEAWFIFISVTTTLFAWVILLPTYFSIFYGYHQEILLAVCLILSSYIMLVCHYMPKVYAIQFVKDDVKLNIKKTAVSSVSYSVQST